MSPTSILFTISKICLDNDFEFIQPKYPFFCLVDEILFLNAIVSKPFCLISFDKFVKISFIDFFSSFKISISERLNSIIFELFFIALARSLLIILSSN